MPIPAPPRVNKNLPTTQQPNKIRLDDSFEQLLKQKVRVPPKIAQGSPFPEINPGDTSLPKPHPKWLAYHIFDNQGQRQSLDDLLTGSSSHIWKQLITNELACLSQGIEDKVKGTNDVRFIKKLKYQEEKQSLMLIWYMTIDLSKRRSLESV